MGPYIDNSVLTKDVVMMPLGSLAAMMLFVLLAVLTFVFLHDALWEPRLLSKKRYALRNAAVSLVAAGVTFVSFLILSGVLK